MHTSSFITSIKENFLIFSLNFSLSDFIDLFLSFVSTLLHGIRARAFFNGVENSSYSNWFIFLFSTRIDSNGRSTKSIFLALWLGAILVTQPLTEDNYPMWSKAMIMALDAKSKLRFVDGTVNASMAITPLEKQAWSKCNSMISSWILNSVSPHLTTSVIYKDTAFEVWNTLKKWFSQANGPRISQL